MILPMSNGPTWLSIAKGILLLLLLTRATCTDLKKKEIEYWVSGTIASIGILTTAFGYGPVWTDVLLAAVISFGVFAVLALMGGGGGDALLMGATATWLGLQLSFMAMIVAGFAGAVMALIWKKKMKEKEVPFAPCIQLGVLAAMVYYLIH